MRGKSYLKSVLCVFFFGLMITGAVTSLFTSCATTGPQAAAINPERQKAIQDSLREIYIRNLDIAWSTGAENRKNKLYDDAIKPFWRVIKMDTISRFPDVYYYLGDCYIKVNKPDSALLVYNMGREAYPEKTSNHRNAAYLLAAKKENQAAIEAYRTAIEQDPGKADDLTALGSLLIAEDLVDEAIPVYQELLKLEPNNVDAQNVFSQLMRRTGDEDAFLDSQEEVLKNDPENTRVMMTLGESYFKRGDYQLTIEKLDMLLALEPENAFALELLASAHQNLGAYRDAIETWEKLLGVKPDHKKALCEMATCYVELKQFVKARNLTNQALKIDPNYGLAYIVRGDVYAAQADACISSREKRTLLFDDKLIYKLAYAQYERALSDIEFADLAKKKMNYVKPDTPTKEDEFMHPDQTQARLDCYQWIY